MLFHNTFHSSASSIHQLFSIINTGGGIGKLEVSKKFEALGGAMKVNPKYNANASTANVILAYDTDDTGVQVEVSSK